MLLLAVAPFIDLNCTEKKVLVFMCFKMDRCL